MQTSERLPTVLVLASGRGERFVASGGRGSKLQALLAGKPVLQHTLAAVRASGLPWHLEDAGHPGMGDSIACAVQATEQAAGWLVLPADLPLVQAATLRLVAHALMELEGLGPDHAVVLPVHEGQQGHPVEFAAKCGPALANLKGNSGGASVVALFSAIKLIVNDIGCATDVDTLADLAQAEQIWQQRCAASATTAFLKETTA